MKDQDMCPLQYQMQLDAMVNMPKQSMCKVSNFLGCPYDKQTRLQFPFRSIKNGACIDLIHFDLQGPYNTPTFEGNKYFNTIMDDHFRTTLLFLLKNKLDIFVSFHVFCSLLKLG